MDWEDDDQEVAAVKIGGVDAYVATPIDRGQCFHYDGLYFADGSVTVPLDVTVPVAVPPGEQPVAVYGPEGLDYIGADGQVVTGKLPAHMSMGRVPRATQLAPVRDSP